LVAAGQERAMTPKRTDAGKTNAKGKAKTTSKKNRASTQRDNTTLNTTKKPRAGDLIVVDSAQVGSPSREGEILQVIERDVTVRYRVKWADGHETLISPGAGTAQVIRKGSTRRS
jgi:Domain of unknown function (DUF1918)